MGRMPRPDFLRHRVSRKDFLRFFLPTAALVAAATVGLTLFLSSLFIAQSSKVLQEQAEDRLLSSMRLFSRINLGSIPPFLATMEEPTIRDYLYGRAWSIEKTQRSLERIDAIIAGNEFVDSIYLYSHDAGLLSTRSGWEAHERPSDPDLAAFLARIGEYGLSRYVMRRTAFEGDAEPRNLFTIVFGTVPPPGVPIPYAFVANLSERRIRAALVGDGTAASALFIVDAEKRFLSHPDADRFGAPVGDDARFVPVLAQAGASGTLIVRDEGGERWIASWADHPEFRWRFVTLAPERVVFAPVLRVRDRVVVIAALVLLATILAAFVLSLQVGERGRRAEAALAYLRGELEPPLVGDGEPASGRPAQRPSSLFPSLRGPGVMAIVQVDGYRALIAERGAHALYDLSLALREALAGLAGSAEVLRLSEASFVVVCGAEREDPRAALAELLAAVGAQAGTMLGAYLYPTPVVAEALPDAFRLLQDARRCDYLRAAGEIVETAGAAGGVDAESETASDVRADEGVELGRLEKALRLDDTEEALRRVDSLLAALRAAKNPDLFRYAVSTLGRRIPEVFGADADTLLAGGADGFRSALARAERLEDAEALLKAAVARLADRGGHHTERRQRDVVDRVKAIVEERVADHALSTAAIAAEVSLSASYLRDLFKRMEGMALLEYVGLRRLELAKQLLVGSEASVREVCDRAGFISYSYFFTYFKKATGKTPTEFREEAVRK